MSKKIKASNLMSLIMEKIQELSREQCVELLGELRDDIGITIEALEQEIKSEKSDD